MIKIQKTGTRISRLLLAGVLAISLLISGVSQMSLFSDVALAIDTSVVVGNNPPTAPVVDVTPDNPETTDDLICYIVDPSFDENHDTVTYTYAWSKNGTPQAALITNTVGSSLTEVGETWKCVVTPNDGWVNGPTAEDQVTIIGVNIESGAGGGGGGGGGGGNTGITSLTEYMTSDGRIVSENCTIVSADGKVKLYLPWGTVGKNRNGQRLYSISIKPQDEPPAPPENHAFVCLNYDLGPSGATFDPPILLTFKYSDLDIPEGVAEENLTLATWYNGQWTIFEGCVVDPVNNIIAVLINHFSTFTVMANTTAASFEVTGMTVTPNEVYPGEVVIVSATVANTGGLAATADVTLKINGIPMLSTQVTLDGGKTETISFSFSSDTTGEYTIDVNGLSSKFYVKEPVPEGTVTEVLPASFTISGLSITPGEVNPSGEVTISAVVTNTGGSQGSYTVILKINGVEEASQEITLGAGKNETVTFNTVKTAAGRYSVDVADNAGQFTVVLLPATSLPEKGAPVQPSSSTNWWIIGGTIAGSIIFIRLAISLYQRRTNIIKSI